ncbi:MAG TPA: hypothetical protein VGK51_07070 [Actinomycetota bacterium]
MRNLVPARYRSVSVTDVGVDLTEAALRSLLVGREAYRRTTYIIARRGERAALVRVEKASDEPLFSPIVALELLAGPDECAVVEDPDTDVGVPSQLARAARRLAPGARCVIVAGRYEHVNFILEPAPLVVRVVEVSPPLPPKLLDQAQRVLDVADDLPPIELQGEVVDLEALAATHPAERYLLPCRGSGAAPPGAEVAYLDQRPAPPGNGQPWTLVGCARSRQLHRWFYGDSEPPNVDICPRELAAASPTSMPTLTKCCLLEEDIVRDGNCVVVPWGASLDEVRRGLSEVALLSEPAWTPA